MTHSIEAARGAAVLPDVLAPGLRILFCGSAAGTASARAGAYYAGPGNRFWQTLHEVSLTPRLLAPGEFALMLEFGLGLTDLSKAGSGADNDLDPGDDDPAALARKVGKYRPQLLAFNGKRAARVFLAAELGLAGSLAYGRQPASLGGTRIWVLPSTSGAARRWWDAAPWFALARAARM